MPADEFIGLDIIGEKEIAALLAQLPEEVQNMAVDDIAEYLLNVLRTYPPQQSITRKQAYEQTFFTNKQRRYFFYALNAGIIQVPYRRTQTLRRGWQKIDQGKNAILVNQTPYADWMMGGHQSRMASKTGWKKIEAIIKERADQIERRLVAAAEKAIKKLARK